MAGDELCDVHGYQCLRSIKLRTSNRVTSSDAVVRLMIVPLEWTARNGVFGGGFTPWLAQNLDVAGRSLGPNTLNSSPQNIDAGGEHSVGK